MRITLAYPYDGHDPDETIEIDDRRGRAMISNGVARPAPALEPDDSWKVADLRSFASTNSIDLGGASTKADILAALAADKTRAPNPAGDGTTEGDAA